MSEHVCGLRGFGLALGDVCPACEEAKKPKPLDLRAVEAWVDSYALGLGTEPRTKIAALLTALRETRAALAREHNIAAGWRSRWLVTASNSAVEATWEKKYPLDERAAAVLASVKDEAT